MLWLASFPNNMADSVQFETARSQPIPMRLPGAKPVGAIARSIKGIKLLLVSTARLNGGFLLPMVNDPQSAEYFIQASFMSELLAKSYSAL